MPSTGIFNSIRGFNQQWTTVTSIAIQRDRVREVIGYKFECGCGHFRKFMLTHFHDPHGAAVNAMNNHHCVSS